MAGRISDRCIYCGGEMVYTGLEKLVKCDFCGKTFSVTKFQGEQAKIKRALEEGEKAKAALKEAEARRDEAQRRLNGAVEQLAGIREEQDTLSRLMRALADTQAESDGKLALIEEMAGRLLETQDDVLAKLDVQKEIVTLLHGLTADAAQRKALEADFIAWSQSIRDEDLERLERLRDDASRLLAGQTELRERVESLRREAEESRQALEAFHDEYQSDKLRHLEQLYRQAEGFQRDRRFDRAAEAYREMIALGGEDAEICWRLVMCRYCLEYQRDDDGSLIPIILNPDLSDPDEVAERRALLEIIDADQSFYRDELARIDAILDNYRELRHQIRYDVFISVKQNENGQQTPDSDKASDLYDYIASKGLRVFNSRRTPIPAGQAFEPYIISALMSARVLIVVGTKPERMNAQWVRNEWSRFQWLQRSDKARAGRTERVLFCYLAGGMQPNQIPKALNPDREAILDGVGATAKLDRALAFLLPKEPLKPAGPERPPEVETLEDVLNQMTVWLYNGQYARVTEKYNQLTERGRFLNSARVHMNALCAERRVRDIEQLVQSPSPLEEEKLFQLAQKLCNESERAWLDGLLAQNREYRKRRKGMKRQMPLWAVGLVAAAVTFGALLLWYQIY